MNLDISPWLILKSVNGVGNILIKRLIEKFSCPEKIFSSTIKELCSVDGMTLKKAESIKKAKSYIESAIESAPDIGKCGGPIRHNLLKK